MDMGEKRPLRMTDEKTVFWKGAKKGMAELLNCRVCNGKVASDAPVCPHCGTPNYADKQETDSPGHFVNMNVYYTGKCNITSNDKYCILIDGKVLNSYKNPKYNPHYVEFFGLDPEVCYTHRLKIGHHEVELDYTDIDFFSPNKMIITKLPFDYHGEDGIEILIGVEFYGLLRNKKMKLESVKCVEKLSVSDHCKSSS